jgi:hypothetical protein
MHPPHFTPQKHYFCFWYSYKGLRQNTNPDLIINEQDELGGLKQCCWEFATRKFSTTTAVVETTQNYISNNNMLVSVWFCCTHRDDKISSVTIASWFQDHNKDVIIFLTTIFTSSLKIKQIRSHMQAVFFLLLCQQLWKNSTETNLIPISSIPMGWQEQFKIPTSSVISLTVWRFMNSHSSVTSH